MLDKTNHVQEAARIALDKANGDIAKATVAMAKEVRSNAMLRNALLNPLIDQACLSVISLLNRKDRNLNWNNAQIRSHVTLTNEQRIKALATDNLLMFRMFDGSLLGDSDREQVMNCSEFYEKQASNMAHKGRFLKLVAQSLPANKKVKQILTPQRLDDLMKEAKNV